LVWIMQRALTTLDYCHGRGIVHANINPDHLVIDPDFHNVSIIGWQHSVEIGKQPKVVNSVYAAPETRDDRVLAFASSDIYSLGKSLIYLVGGNPARNMVPGSLPKELAAVLRSMTVQSPIQRPEPHAIYERIGELREQLYHGETYAEFRM